jgi:hypothetical protein
MAKPLFVFRGVMLEKSHLADDLFGVLLGATTGIVGPAPHLIEHVFQVLLVRQWVLSVPKRLRYFMQRYATELNCTLRLFLRAIRSALIERSDTIKGFSNEEINDCDIGAVVFIHRFSSDIACVQVCLISNFVVTFARLMAFLNQPTKACSSSRPGLLVLT